MIRYDRDGDEGNRVRLGIELKTHVKIKSVYQMSYHIRAVERRGKWHSVDREHSSTRLHRYPSANT